MIYLDSNKDLNYLKLLKQVRSFSRINNTKAQILVQFIFEKYILL